MIPHLNGLNKAVQDEGHPLLGKKENTCNLYHINVVMVMGCIFSSRTIPQIDPSEKNRIVPQLHKTYFHIWGIFGDREPIL